MRRGLVTDGAAGRRACTERKAKERLEAAKKLKADMSAEYEAAVHVVPQRSTLSAIIGEALDAAVV